MWNTTKTMRTDLKRRLGLAIGALIAMTLPAVAGICEKRDFDGPGYVVCTLEAAQEPGLKLWLNGPDGKVLGDFTAVRRTLAPGETLAFAMNAGMYHADYTPVGLYVSEGDKAHDIVTGSSNYRYIFSAALRGVKIKDIIRSSIVSHARINHCSVVVGGITESTAKFKYGSGTCAVHHLQHHQLWKFGAVACFVV